MSKVLPKDALKSLSATPPLARQNGMIRTKELGDHVGSIPHTPSPSLPTTPAAAGFDHPKSDSDHTTMICDTPPPPNPPTPSAKKPPHAPPQLISHLPCAEQEALSVFTEIPDNQYQYSTLGRSREALESMTCDCQYDPGATKPGGACGHDSDCINRLTQVECLPDDCRCRSYCKNQRFQRKEYADIEIVQTEKKGFGLRAGADLRTDTFIYEYVGEVVSQPSFQKRMREYAQEGIRHFYFMMLQKDEFIDATKRGGIGRFANHSCNPNCYVAKWTVGRHVRMGIFASRLIRKDEELTFNYNVDRYGHDAQPCYCGEPNCVGFIGGKTQTDLAVMDDLYLDALGIAEEVDRLGLKGTKKKKGKKIDDPDFAPTLKPLMEKEVPKVVQAIRQTQSRKVLCKLLTRIKITEDQPALRQIMRLRGFSLMTNILEDYVSDLEVVVNALECMVTWPLLQRNKVDDSKITVPVKICAESENETVRTLAQKLLDHWDTLSSAYRIPKRAISDGDEEVFSVTTFENTDDGNQLQKRSRYDGPEVKLEIKPLGFRRHHMPQAFPVHPVVTQNWEQEHFQVLKERVSKREQAANLIANLKAAAVANEAAAKSEPSSANSHENASRKSSSPKKHQSKEERERIKEKRLKKLVGDVVVKCMSKHKKEIEHESFKEIAKELTETISEKEKKSSSYREGRLDALSEEKVTKIKKFAKDYINKILRKMEKSKKRRRPPSTPATLATSSTTMTTPDPHGTTSANGDDHASVDELVLDETMDMDTKSESGDETMVYGDANGEDEEDRSFQPQIDDGSPLVEMPNPMHFLAKVEVTSTPLDPRLRLPSEDGWGSTSPDKLRLMGLVDDGSARS